MMVAKQNLVHFMFSTIIGYYLPSHLFPSCYKLLGDNQTTDAIRYVFQTKPFSRVCATFFLINKTF
jgi:hypothetical protein